MAFVTHQSLSHGGGTVIYERDDTSDGGYATAGRHRIRVTFGGNPVTATSGGEITAAGRPALWYGTVNGTVRRYMAFSYDPGDFLMVPIEAVDPTSPLVFYMENIST